MKLDRFRVADLQAPNCNNVVLFILESPHKDEFSHGHPIAGQAGRRLLSLLHKAGVTFEHNDYEPLGCQIKKGKIKNIGVINVSQVPLDANFYCDKNCNSVKELASIKKRLQKNTQKKYIPKDGVESELFKNFTARLNLSISDSTQIVIPLGHLASNFVKSVEGLKCQIHYGVSHPSSSTWNSEKNVAKLKQGISSLITNS